MHFNSIAIPNRGFVTLLPALALLLGATPAFAVSLTLPQQYEVFQRTSVSSGNIYLQGSCSPATSAVEIEVSNADGAVIGTTTLSASGGSFHGAVPVPAGGWYTVSASEGGNGPPTTVPTVGVGEVFITAGQSNSGHFGEAPQPTGPWASAGTMSFDSSGGSPSLTWSKDIDPGTAYVVDYQHFGSPWASFATELSQWIGVPVAVIPVGCGATRVTQWLPPQSPSNPPDLSSGCGTGAASWFNLPSQPGNLYQLLKETAQTLDQVGSFRAVLWHQGESDAINIFDYHNAPAYLVPGAVIDRNGYAAAMKTIVSQLNSDLGHNVPWVIANASYFPSSDVDSTNNCALTGKGIPANVQQAMDEVVAGQNIAIQQGIVHQGPDTDDLTGAPLRYYGWDTSKNVPYGGCIHLSRLGLAVHGARWSYWVLADGLIPGKGYAPTGGTVPLTLSVARSNDQLQGWPAASSVTASSGTDYSSNIFPNYDNSRVTYLAAWMSQGSWVSEVDLDARMANGKALGFPGFYDVYLTASDNSTWTYVGQYGYQPDSSGVARIPLVSSFYTYGVMIVPRILGTDSLGNYFFQLGGVKLLK